MASIHSFTTWSAVFEDSLLLSQLTFDVLDLCFAFLGIGSGFCLARARLRALSGLRGLLWLVCMVALKTDICQRVDMYEFEV